MSSTNNRLVFYRQISAAYVKGVTTNTQGGPVTDDTKGTVTITFFFSFDDPFSSNSYIFTWSKVVDLVPLIEADSVHTEATFSPPRPEATVITEKTSYYFASAVVGGFGVPDIKVNGQIPTQAQLNELSAAGINPNALAPNVTIASAYSGNGGEAISSMSYRTIGHLNPFAPFIQATQFGTSATWASGDTPKSPSEIGGYPFKSRRNLGGLTIGVVNQSTNGFVRTTHTKTFLSIPKAIFINLSTDLFAPNYMAYPDLGAIPIPPFGSTANSYVPQFTNACAADPHNFTQTKYSLALPSSINVALSGIAVNQIVTVNTSVVAVTSTDPLIAGVLGMNTSASCSALHYAGFTAVYLGDQTSEGFADVMLTLTLNKATFNPAGDAQYTNYRAGTGAYAGRGLGDPALWYREWSFNAQAVGSCMFPDGVMSAVVEYDTTTLLMKDYASSFSQLIVLTDGQLETPGPDWLGDTIKALMSLGVMTRPLNTTTNHYGIYSNPVAQYNVIQDSGPLAPPAIRFSWMRFGSIDQAGRRATTTGDMAMALS